MILEIVLIIIGMILSFLAVSVCTFAKPSEKQKYSFLSTISACIYFTIGFLNIWSDTVDQFVIYQKFAFTAGIYMMIGFAFAISYMFDVKYSNRTKLIITISSIILVVIFTTFSDSYPWAKSIEMILDEKCSLYHFKVNGYWLYYLLNAIAIICLITWLVIIVIKTSNKKGREFKLFRYLLGFTLVPLFIWIFSVLGVLPSLISNEIVFMIILLVNMHVEIFYTLAIDRKRFTEPLIDSTNNGLIILDSKKRFVFANNAACSFIDILNSTNKDAITAFLNVNLVEENSYFDGTNRYDIILEEISDSTNPRIGYSLWMIKKNEKEKQENE